jgi:hypothetical protein
MLALTIWQPWASLVMIGAKPFEFRGKSYLEYMGHPAIGDRIVVHAGARKMRVAEVADLLNKLDDPNNDNTGLDHTKAKTLLQRIWSQPSCAFQALPLGAGLGTAVIGEPRYAGEIFERNIIDSDRGDYFNWAWPLTHIEPFMPPIPMRGLQGFWRWPHQVEAA